VRLHLCQRAEVFDQKLISRFEWLRRRPSTEIAAPPLFMVFDCPE
jgi:hypothetical protein